MSARPFRLTARVIPEDELHADVAHALWRLLGGYHRWTDGDDAILRRGYANGAPVAEIAGQLGVSLHAAKMRARLLGLRHRRGQWSLADRFDRKWIGEPNSGCWLWLGSIDRKGYGQIRDPAQNRLRIATHVSIELHGGSVPPGMCVLHRCDVPGCVNPDHLFIGTAKENTHDMIRKGRASPPPRRGMLQ